jgi:TolB protein
MRRGSAMLAAIVGLAVVFAWQPAFAASPIVVARGQDLFTFSPRDGLTRLTDSPRIERDPAWSPDHRRVAFVAGNRSLVWLDTMASIRHRVVRIPPRFEGIGAVAWSPDGSRLVFSTTTETGEHRLCGQVWVAPAFGRGPALKILGAQAWITGLGWGSDGGVMASAEWPNGIRICGPAARTGVLRFAPDGSRLTVVAGTTASSLDRSESGRRIVYRGWLRTCHACGEIWVSAVDGARAHVISMPTGDMSGLYSPRFSPDGRRVAMLVGRRGHTSLWIMGTDGSRRHLVLQHASSLDW